MIGKTISHYQVISKIGEGGMGEVFLAEDISLGRRVALKFLPSEMQRDDVAHKRFLREARSAAALNHPYICSIHEVSEVEGKDFIVMEFVEGLTLKERLAQGPFPMRGALRIAAEIAEGLEHAHEKGIIHRDLKPANIMLAERGHVKIMDFGLAKQVKEAEKALGNEDTLTALTKEGSTLGTLAYMSPEQLRGAAVDARSDIFSFGILFYEMLTGIHPFREASPMDTASRILNKEPAPLSLHLERASESTQQLVSRMLAKDLGARYSDIRQLRADLARVIDLTERADVLKSRAVSARFWRTFGRPLVVIPALIILIAAVYLSSITIYQNRKVHWARDVVPNEVERLQLSGKSSDLISAFNLARDAKGYLPGDQEINTLWDRVSTDFKVITDPPGGHVYIKPYDSPQDAWLPAGISPLTVRLANLWWRCKIEKEGYDTITAVTSSRAGLLRTLDKTAAVPTGMIRVTGPANKLQIARVQTAKGNTAQRSFKLPDFFLDKYEVTNRQFREFIRAGGYQKQSYWRYDFEKEGRKLEWEQAMALFKDATGRAGPATWQAGDFPEAQEDYPVAGISWYEAAAYAEFAQKSLPTIWHWGVPNDERSFGGVLSQLIQMSNFGTGPKPVGTQTGINSVGAYDMAGNVREWCWNSAPKGKCIRGGAWDDAPYMYSRITQADPFDRSARNGFRCVEYPDIDRVPEAAFQPFLLTGTRDFYKTQPVSDSTFQAYRNLFSYDKGELNPQIESEELSPNWIRQKITFDAAYGSERMMAWLYIPRNVRPMFDLLGTPPKDKLQKVYDTDHYVPRNELIKECLAFLDQYFGPVKTR